MRFPNDPRRIFRASASGVLSALALALPSAQAEAADAPAGRYDCEPDRIEVMFVPESRVRLRDGSLRDLGAPALAGVDAALAGLSGVAWQRICDLPEATLDRWSSEGEAKTGSPVYNLNNIYHLRAANAGDIWDLAARLEALPGVLSARPVPRPVEPPLPPDYGAQQGYRAPANWTPSGTHNALIHLYPGGNGAGVRICDLEYAWNLNHADISQAAGSSINPGASNPFGDDHHGTAVIGMLSADENLWGVSGLAPAATLLTCGTFFGSPTPVWNVPGAMAIAMANLSAGDVILLEQQWDYNDPNTPGQDFVPIEWWTNSWPNAQTVNAVYAAMLNAAANGIHVVEAAGNGGVNLDNLVWWGNTGAILVGAGGAYPGGPHGGGDRERLAFSSFGSRVNVQGWGENVVTTGYGDLYSSMGANYRYTGIFSGTSSASAHVAAAVACYSGFHRMTHGSPVAPLTLRQDLEAHGTPQAFGPAGTIGPRPDLLRIVMSFQPGPISAGGDWGDAPQGVVAYPATVPPRVGWFPTTLHGPGAGYMFHAPVPVAQIHLGNRVDFEYEGNGGLLFGPDLAYDGDECGNPAARSSDQGLLLPKSYSIQGGSVVACSPNPRDELGGACGLAAWGTDIDLQVVNDTWVTGYLNVLVDWNQDGFWGGSGASCPGVAVEEHALRNFPIPQVGPSPVAVSSLPVPPPPLRIGSASGYVWARFTVTDAPIPAGAVWDGSLGAGWAGITVIGETEDYLLKVGSFVATEVAEAGAAAAPVPWIAAAAQPNPFRDATVLRLRLAAAGRVDATIYDARGRRVRTLAAGPLAAGEHALRWDGDDEAGGRAAAGIYFCRVRGAGVEETVKLSFAP